MVMRKKREGPLFDFSTLIVKILLIVLLLENEIQIRNQLNVALTNVWQFIWEVLAKEDKWTAFVLLTNVWAAIVYWIVGLAFAFLDFQNFEFIKPYKIQQGVNEPVDSKKFLGTAVQVLFNQFIVGPSLAVLVLPLLSWRGIDFTANNIPGLTTFFRHLTGYIFCEEIGFYYSHRLFHEIKPFYKAFHKQHHEWVAPIAIAARYAHPVEDILANVFPVMLGPFLMRSPLVFWWIWLAIAMVSTLIGHSGYHFPWLPSSEFHDFHHLRFDCNYGAFGILDALHNTDLKFRNSIQSLRHFTLDSLAPARQRIPDDTKLE